MGGGWETFRAQCLAGYAKEAALFEAVRGLMGHERARRIRLIQKLVAHRRGRAPPPTIEMRAAYEMFAEVHALGHSYLRLRRAEARRRAGEEWYVPPTPAVTWAAYRQTAHAIVSRILSVRPAFAAQVEVPAGADVYEMLAICYCTTPPAARSRMTPRDVRWAYDRFVK
jgi:hypothetical protein